MNQHLSRNRWRKEAGIAVLVFAGPLLLLCPYWPWRPATDFTATIRTDAIELKIGGETAARPFTSLLANLTIDGADRIEGAFEQPLHCGRLVVTQAQISSLLLMPGTGAYIESRGPRGAVRLQLRYPANLAQAPVQTFLSEGSSVHCDGEARTVDRSTPIKVFPQSLELAVTMIPVAPGGGPAKLADAFVPVLEEGSAVGFLTTQGANGVHLFADNALNIASADRRVPVTGTIEIADLHPGTAAQISAEDDGLTVRIKGSAGVLRIAGRDSRPSWAEYLRARTDVSAWIATAVLIGTTIMTVLSRLKLIQLEGKS